MASGSITTASGAVKLVWIAKLKSIPQTQIDAYISSYTGSHPGVTVQLTTAQFTAPGLAKLKAIQASGEQLDMVSTLAGIPDLRQLDGGYPLNSLIAQSKFDTTQFAGTAFDGVTVKGQVLALPHAYAGNEVVLVANRSLFQKAGVALPPADWAKSWTWQEFRDLLKRLTALSGPTPVVGTSRFGTIYDIPPMWDAQWASNDGQTVTCDSPAMIEAFTNYYDFILKDRTASFSPGVPKISGNAFYAGQAATFTICCAVPTTTDVLKTHNIDFAFVPFPQAKRAVPDIGPAVIAVWKQSKHVDAAWSFVQWSVEQGRLANLEERLPSQKTAISPYIEHFYGALPSVQPQVFQQMTAYIPPQDPLFVIPAAGEAETAITNALKPVQAGKQTVQDALTALKPQLQAILARYKSAEMGPFTRANG